MTKKQNQATLKAAQEALKTIGIKAPMTAITLLEANGGTRRWVSQ